MTRRTVGMVIAAALVLLGGWGCGGGWVRLDEVEDCPAEVPSRLPDSPSRRDLACILKAARTASSLSARQHQVAARAASDLSAGESHPDRAEALADEGLAHARKALLLEDDPVSHYCVGMLWGLSISRRPLAALKALSAIEAHLKRAAEEAPDEDAGGPLRVLGMLYLKAPSWPQGIGDPEKGLQLLERAAAEHPDHPLNLLFLARALRDNEEEGFEDRVPTLVRQALERMNQRDFGWPAQRWRKEAEDLLQ